MHVDVDLARIERDEQRHDRMAVARQIVRIGAAHHADQELVAHRPAVDEQILPERIGARERRQRREALDRDAVALAAHLDRVGAELGAEDVGEPRQPSGRAGQRRRPGHRRALLAREREGDVGPAHGEAAHHLADRLALGAVALEELEPRRRRVEQVAHLDAGAFAERRRLHRRISRRRRPRSPRRAARSRAAWRSRAAPPRRSRAAPRRGSRACGCRGGRRRRASRWRGARPRARGRPRVMPAPSSLTRMSRRPPPSVAISMRRRAGVERVLDQFLDHARRPLDHLAGGDAVDDGLGELADGHGRLCE